MPRITKADLEAENGKLKAELQQYRERSRSSKRRVEFVPAPLSANGRRALDILCKHDRDPVIEEQRATIDKQAQQIADLTAGKGPIGPVLQSVHGRDSFSDVEFWGRIAQERTESVADFIKKLHNHATIVSDLTFCARTYRM